MLPSVVTIGIFDGVHLGHQAMLQLLMEAGKSAGLRTVVLTFHPHPKTVLSAQPYPLLQTPDERHQKLLDLGIDEVRWIDFTPEFAQMRPEVFVSQVLVEMLNVKKIVIGHDHRFGKDRSGDFDLLQQLGANYGFEVTEMPAVLLREAVISSSRIRKLLSEHQLEAANALMGSVFTFSGIVVHGEKRGRTIGFPTANLEIPTDKIVPGNGVYAVSVQHKGKIYQGMMNIGKRPTFDAEKTIEVHILDFEEDIYGETLTIKCHHFLRHVQKFDGIATLVAQLEADRLAVRQYFQ